MLGTFGLEPSPPLVNEQYLQSSSLKCHSQVMLPVGADTAKRRKSPGCHSPCTSLGGPGQKMPFLWHQGIQSKGREAEVGHMPFFKGWFPWAVLIGKAGLCTFIHNAEGTNRRKKMLALKKASNGLSDEGTHPGPADRRGRVPADVSSLQSLKAGSSFG